MRHCESKPKTAWARAAACFLLALSAVADDAAPNSVQLGRWTIAPAPDGHFAAAAPDEPNIQIEITPDGEDVKVPADAAELAVSDAGAVFIHVEADVSPVQMQQTFNDVYVRKEFYCRQSEHWIVLTSFVDTRTWRVPTEAQSLADALSRLPSRAALKQFAESVKAEVITSIEADPALNLLQLMLREKIILGTRVYVTGPPTAEASVDGAPFSRLRSTPGMKGGDDGWILPARPGQRVVFRFTQRCKRDVVTTHGISVIEDEGALRGTTVWLREYPPGYARDAEEDSSWVKSAVDEHGVAVVDYGVLKSPLLLEMQLGTPCRDLRPRHVYLRWGRPEEAWLDNLYFPVKPPVTEQTEDIIRAIVDRLEASYDWDRGEFLEVRAREQTYEPTPSDTYALDGINLAPWPHLSAAMPVDDFSTWIERTFDRVLDRTDAPPGDLEASSLAGMALDAAQSAKYGPTLWEDLSGSRPEESSGWHDPRIVYGLAVLWERFPDLRDRNVFARVLEYWLDAIRRDPAPVIAEGKNAVLTEGRVEEYGYAVAALHIAHRVFGDPDYLRARDAVLDMMRQLPVRPKNRPYYDAMTARRWWLIDDHSNYPGEVQSMCGFASIYGQTCAFLGNHDELEKAQDWIRWAAMREGQSTDAPFLGGQSPAFNHRCGMIGALRGRAAYLTARDGNAGLSILSNTDAHER